MGKKKSQTVSMYCTEYRYKTLHMTKSFYFSTFELASLSFFFLVFFFLCPHDTWWPTRRLQSEQRSNRSYHPLVTTETVKALVHQYAYTLYAHFIVVLLAAPPTFRESAVLAIYFYHCVVWSLNGDWSWQTL